MATEMDVLRNRIAKGWPLSIRQAIEYLDIRGGEIAEENEELDKVTRVRRKSGRKKKQQGSTKRR